MHSSETSTALLKGTLDYKLCHRKCDDGLTLIGYNDADWASSTDDRHSISGYCFSLNRTGPLISWKSRKQLTVAVSSCEAELLPWQQQSRRADKK